MTDDVVRPAVAIVCHCGERFPIDDLDAAQAHVAGHTAVPGAEPS